MKVFISRNLDPTSLLVTKARAVGWTLNAVSLIHHLPTGARIPDSHFDYIFFSSPTAVRHFYANYGLPTVSVCTLGPGTSAALPSGATPHFQGDGTTSEVAAQYASFAQGKTTLFPIGSQSLQTIQQGLNEQEVLNFVCYETHANPKAVGAHDIYVFSSPSNVDSFLIDNEIASGASVIALGEKTKKALKDANIEAMISKDYTQEGILDTIFSIERS